MAWPARASRFVTRRFALAVGLAAASGCGRCGTRDETPREAPSTASRIAGPAGWELGPMPGRAGFAWPPPCQIEDQAWRAELGGRTELYASGGALGALLVESGPREHASFGVMQMALGLATVTPWPKPNEGDAWLAVAEPWMLVGTPKSGARVWLRRGPTQEPETLTEGEGVEVVSARCDDGQCAVLAHARTGGSGDEPLTLYLGGATEPASQWHRIPVRSSEWTHRHASIEAVRAASAIVSIDNGARIVWVEGSATGTRDLGQIDEGEDPVASAFDAQGTAWLATKSHIRLEGTTSGGVRLTTSEGARVELRSPTPPTRAVVHPIGGGALALWVAPRAEGGTQALLHGATVRRSGKALPVTVVAEADGFAVAAKDDRIDVWVKDDGAVTFARLRCIVGQGEAASPTESKR